MSYFKEKIKCGMDGRIRHKYMYTKKEIKEGLPIGFQDSCLCCGHSRFSPYLYQDRMFQILRSQEGKDE